MAIMRATSYLKVSGRSCVLAMRPHPIWATLILLLGAFFPNTVEGTMVGKAEKATAPIVMVPVFFKNVLRLFSFGCTVIFHFFKGDSIAFNPPVSCPAAPRYPRNQNNPCSG